MAGGEVGPVGEWRLTTPTKRKVTYYYDQEVGNYYYGLGHPMKPHRIRMAHDLLVNYGIYDKMQIYRPHKATFNEMTMYHTDDYVNFLKRVSPMSAEEVAEKLQTPNLKSFNMGDTDSPVFEGLYEFCQLSSGGSIDAANELLAGNCDIAINWAGGLHHAKKSEASGFCYINDIVLGIIELLKVHQRVLYIDIDIHHGDGVEEAFYTSDRVMTASFHKFGEYFPGTGDVEDIGCGRGRNYSINFPLAEGIDDDAYRSVFRPVIAKIMEMFRPGAVVLQCGADSLSGDKLGCFNLSLEGHADCVAFLRSFNVPLMLLGGGGYTIRNVARCWTFETAVAVGEHLDPDLPYNEYFDYYGPNYSLKVHPTNMENKNSLQYLNKMKERIFEILRHVPPVPSVQMQAVPRESVRREINPDKLDPDVRLSKRPNGHSSFNPNTEENETERSGRKALPSMPVSTVVSTYGSEHHHQHHHHHEHSPHAVQQTRPQMGSIMPDAKVAAHKVL